MKHQRPVLPDVIADLRKNRPRDYAARFSLGLLFVLGIGSWWAGDFGVTELASARRLANLTRFAGELIPYPLQDTAFEAGVLLDWTGTLLRTRGLGAAVNTVAISIAAIFLAGCGGAGLALLGARTLATAAPWLPSTRPSGWLPWAGWQVLGNGARVLMVFFRSIPEYVWAFLFLAMLGPVAWPLVLALALHNTGILGRLGAEVVENTESPPLTALRALGATRAQIAASAIFPLAFSRFLLFFLYRWETCVREATVLGMLGISSLGFWIQDARARNFYDEMFLLIVIGGLLVIGGDLISALAREWLRRQD
jgi:phosphonate transport system permease protein